LQKGKEAVYVILFRDVPHSAACIERLDQCHKFLDDPSLLSSSYVVQSNVSPGAFMYFMEILDATERHLSPETFDDLMLLAREFGHNSLITRLVPQRDFPRREGNPHKLLQ
jgi:hypothetical protein